MEWNMAATANNTYTINLRRTLKVPLERLNRAIENAEERKLWLDPVLHFDFHPGGKIYTHEGMPIGEFVEFLSAQRWRLLWISPLNADGSRVTIEFCRVSRAVSRIHIRHWNITRQKDYEELYTGWLWFLDSLERYFVTCKYLEYDYPDVFGSITS